MSQASDVFARSTEDKSSRNMLSLLTVVLVERCYKNDTYIMYFVSIIKYL